MKTIGSVKAKLLPIIEARLQEGFYLSRGGLSAGFRNGEMDGGVCLAGLMVADKIYDEEAFHDYRGLAARRLGLTVDEWLCLESGFENRSSLRAIGRPLNDFDEKLVDLGADVADTYGAIYRAIRET